MHHPSAIISPKATIGENVSIGAFSIIDENVIIGDNTKIDPHVWITGKTTIGHNCFFGFGSQIGGSPQDLSFDPNTKSGTIIGNNNTFRENITIHRSTSEKGNTLVGNNNFLMVNSHLAHDVSVGDNNVIANNCMLAGHITLGSHIFLGGGAGFHQFINIGDYAICKGNASISKDIPPFCLAHGDNKLSGLNVIGLRRANFTPPERADIKKAYKLLFKSGLTTTEAIASARNIEWTKASQQLIAACTAPSKKGILNN